MSRVLASTALIVLHLSGCARTDFPAECDLHPERCCDIRPEAAVCADSSSPVGDSAFAESTSPDSSGAPDEGGPGVPEVSEAATDAGITPKSCLKPGEGRTNCGADGLSSCCESLLVPGGSFSRAFDGVTSGYADASFKSTISPFKLDRFEVTVGRFSTFVDAVVDGWRPSEGDGKHSHLNAGAGLALEDGGAEPGWSVAWNVHLMATKPEWNGVLLTPGGGAEIPNYPVARVNWYQAAAFCVWDGGFLPSEAEWNFAASGGSEHRVYPWSIPPASTLLTEAHAWFDDHDSFRVVGKTAPTGDGRWGHSDLSGNAAEWMLDAYRSPLTKSCIDCTNAFLTENVVRGGSVRTNGETIRSAVRAKVSPTTARDTLGLRCARPPTS